ncbi:MAG TPA: serine/threonine-protein kinase [Oligoflexia bacterium]|nr:serine/threonine-protein kinase [Oligoflexia bacterium]HMP48489.1 serine/threonine-protein kinase [Oligoflexia bacterium]
MAIRTDPGFISNLRDQLLAVEGKDGLALEPGTLIGEEYVIEKKINEGGSAVIYKCHPRSEPDKVYAIKVTYPQSANAARRFQAEVTASYQVRHPHVLRSIDCIIHGKALAYIMEYAPGGDLRDVLDKGKEIPISTFLIIARQLSAGLSAIHKKAIVHRDIKPENILFSADGQIKIADFGISFSSQVSRITANGSLVGTINYMAPEYVKRGIFDPRADIFSLGIMLYELLTGKHPYGYSKSLEELLEKMEKPIPPVHAIRPDCPLRLSSLLSRIIAVNPEERIQFADELEIEFTEIEQEYCLNVSEDELVGEIKNAMPRMNFVDNISQEPLFGAAIFISGVALVGSVLIVLLIAFRLI